MGSVSEENGAGSTLEGEAAQPWWVADGVTRKERHVEVALISHMGNTGGLSVVDMVQREYRASEYYPGECHYGTLIKEIRRMDRKNFENIRCIPGHGVRYGLHEFIPWPCTYVTFLRDPIQHRISDYHYIWSRPEHSEYERYHRENITLEQFTQMCDNPYLYWFRHLKDYSRPRLYFARSKPEIYNSVIQSFQRSYAVVGITEMFDESLFLLGYKLGWSRHLYWINPNSNPKAARKRDTPLEMQQKIANACPWDIALYRWAKDNLRRELDALPREVRDTFDEYVRRRKLYSEVRNKLMGYSADFLHYLVDNRHKRFVVIGKPYNFPNFVREWGSEVIGIGSCGMDRQGESIMATIEGLELAVLENADRFLITDPNDHFTEQLLLKIGIEKAKIMYPYEW